MVDDKTILEAINDLSEIAEYGLVVYQNPDFGYIYVDVGNIRFGLNPFEVQHPRRTEILVHYELGQTVYSNTDIDVEVFTQPAIQEPVELQQILAEWGLPFVHVDELGNLRVSASETDKIWFSARPNWVSELVDDATEIGLFLPIPTAAFSVFVDELGQKRAQLFYPVPADMSALIESAREVDFTPEGFLRFELNGQYYEGLLDFFIWQGDAIGDELMVEEVADTNDDGLDDFLITYPNGAQQLLWRFY